jgi:hypothetical protein
MGQGDNAGKVFITKMVETSFGPNGNLNTANP